MFVTCDNCGGRFRIAPEKVPASGVRARCAGCSSILLLRREGDRVVVAPAAPRQPLPPPQPVPEPDVELPDAGTDAVGDSSATAGAAPGAADPFSVQREPPEAPPAPPPLPPSALPDEDSPWGAVAAPEVPPPPPPPLPEPEDDPFASLSAPPLPEEVSFGNLAGIDADEAREPSFVTGAVPIEEEKSARSAGAEPVAAGSRQRTASRLHLATAARKAPVEGPVSKTIWSALVVGALVYGVLVGLHRDPTRLWERLLPGAGTAALQASDLVAGVYPANDGERLAYLTGSIEGRTSGGEGVGIRVVGELLDEKGAVVTRSEGWAGALPTPEEIAAVVDEESWERLSRGLARSGPGGEQPFVVAFPGAKVPAGRIGYRVTLREEPLPPTGTTVVED